MIWQDIAIIVSSIIVSVGGAGGIIVAISKWVGGIIANNIIQKNQAKYDKELEEFKADYQKEIEEYKSQLNIACEAIKKKNTESIYVTEKQFDIEIALIQELTEKAFALMLSATVLFPKSIALVPEKETEFRKKYDENIFNEEIETRHAFIKILGKARTFIEEKFYEKYKNFQDKCALQEFYFLEKQLCNIPYEGDELNQCLKRSDEIRSIHEEVVLDIKEYLKKLKIMN